MTRIVLRTKQNGVFSGTLKNVDAEGLKSGVFLEMDAETGVSIWCPRSQIDELIDIPGGGDIEVRTGD